MTMCAFRGIMHHPRYASGFRGSYVMMQPGYASKFWNSGLCASLAVYTRCNGSIAVVLQHVVAVRYSVLQCVAVFCDVLRLMCAFQVMRLFGPLRLLRQLYCGGVAVVLQCVAVCCSVLRCVAAYVRVPSHGPHQSFRCVCNTLQQTVTRCDTLQHTATYCNMLQHTATQWNTMQHTATHR